MKPTTETTITQTSTTDTGHICPKYEQAIQLLGKRWTGLLLYTLLEGPKRFCELTSTVEGLSDRVLSDRLRELELEGVVERVVYPQIPVRVEYKLTDKGRALEPVVLEIQKWATSGVTLLDSSLQSPAE